jgi:fucose permease
MAVETNNRPIKVLLHFVFLLSGIATILIGQVLPMITKRFSLNDLEAGNFFPAQFFGSILGTFLTDWFGRKHKYLAAIVIGCVSMAVGVLLMNSGLVYLCMFGFFINGLGVGLTLPSVNMLVLEMNPLHGASALNILNFCWGVGAIICKPFVDSFSSGSSILPATLLLAVPFALSGGAIALAGRGVEKQLVSEEGVSEPASKIAIWSTVFAWVLALFNFIHVGFESGIGGWLTTYSERIDYAASIRVLSPTFIFYVLFVAGRGIAPVFFKFLSENVSMLVSLIIILAGMGVTLAADSAITLSIGAALSGFGTSSVFPTSLARFRRVFGESATRRAMPLFIAGTSGSIAITWLIGFFSNRAGDLRSGMYVLLVGIVALVLLQIVIMGRTGVTAKLN